MSPAPDAPRTRLDAEVTPYVGYFQLPMRPSAGGIAFIERSSARAMAPIGFAIGLPVFIVIYVIGMQGVGGAFRVDPGLSLIYAAMMAVAVASGLYGIRHSLMRRTLTIDGVSGEITLRWANPFRPPEHHRVMDAALLVQPAELSRKYRNLIGFALVLYIRHHTVALGFFRTREALEAYAAGLPPALAARRCGDGPAMWGRFT